MGLRVPPHSIEAEESALGGVLLNNDVWSAVATTVDMRDFYRPAHRLLFETMGALAAAGQPIDVVTVAEAVRERGLLEKTGGAAYIAELAEATPAAANAAAYAAIVRERAARRGLLAVAQSLEGAAYGDDAVPIGAAVAEVESALQRVAGQLVPGRLAVPLRELPPVEGLEWVVDELFDRQGIYLSVGLPKTGKTTTLRTLAAIVAAGGGEFLGRRALGGRVAYVDFENSSGRGRQRWHDLQAPFDRSLDGLYLTLGAHALPGAPLEIVAGVLREVQPDLLCVDGLGALLPAGGDKSSDGGYTAIGGLMGSLRRLAELHDCAIILQHHAPWGDASRPLGSANVAGQVDGTLVHEREECPGGDARFSVKTAYLRDGEDLRGELRRGPGRRIGFAADDEPGSPHAGNGQPEQHSWT